MKLGLDISTTNTGYCILDDNGNIIDLGVLNFTNKKTFPDLFSKAQAAQTFFNTINNKYSIDSIGIEAALLGFSRGKSSALTISTLLKFNGIISWLVFSVFGVQPQFISASTARKNFGIKITKGQKAKLTVMEHLLKNDKIFPFYIKYTRTGSIAQYCYDMADAYVISKSIN